ncbi:MAG: hypothetical protein AAB534_03140 [Patescibacteria group bacterium]
MKLTKKINKYLTTAKIIALAVILSAGISIVYGWTGPTAAPFGGNVEAPINAGSSEQTKLGKFNVIDSFWGGFLGSTGGGFINSNFEIGGTLKITSGSPSTGKALVATDNEGTLGWSTSLVASSLSCTTGSASGVGSVTAECGSLPKARTGGGGSCPNSSIEISEPVGDDEWSVTCQESVPVTAFVVCCEFLFPAQLPE